MLKMMTSLTVTVWLLFPPALRAGGQPLEILDFTANCTFGICEFCVDDPVLFFISWEGDPEVFSYDWDGDGIYDEDSPMPIGSHTYTTPQSGFFPTARISARAEEDEFTQTVSMNIIDCGPPNPTITVGGPAALEVGEAGLYTASAVDCAPSAHGWSWLAFGGGILTGDTTTDQVSISWPTSGIKTVTASNRACGSTQGTQLVEVVEAGGLVFLDGFESGDTSAW